MKNKTILGFARLKQLKIKTPKKEVLILLYLQESMCRYSVVNPCPFNHDLTTNGPSCSKLH